MASTLSIILVITTWFSAISCAPMKNPYPQITADAFIEAEKKLREGGCFYPAVEVIEPLRSNCVGSSDNRLSVCNRTLSLGLSLCAQPLWKKFAEPYINQKSLYEALKDKPDICAKVSESYQQWQQQQRNEVVALMGFLEPLVDVNNCLSTCQDNFNFVCQLHGVAVIKLIRGIIGSEPSGQPGVNPAATKSPARDGSLPSGNNSQSMQQTGATGNSPTPQASPPPDGNSNDKQPSGDSGSATQPGSGGSTANGSGGSTANGSGGSTAVGNGGSTAVGNGGSTAVGNGGGTAVGNGGGTANGSGGSTAVGNGGSTAVGNGGGTAVGNGGGTANGSGGSTANGSGGSTAVGNGGSTAVGSGGSTAVGNGGNTAVGNGGNTAVGNGGNTAVGNGGNTAVGNGGGTAVGNGGGTAVGNGGGTAVGNGGSTANGSGGSTANGSGGSTAVGNGGSTAQGNASTAVGSGGSVALDGNEKKPDSNPEEPSGGKDQKIAPTISSLPGTTQAPSLGGPTRPADGVSPSRPTPAGDQRVTVPPSATVEVTQPKPNETEELPKDDSDSEETPPGKDDFETEENGDTDQKTSGKGSNAEETDKGVETPKDKGQGAGAAIKKETQNFRVHDEELETESSGHFMAYFLTAAVLCIAGYVIFHNKQKIIAFIVEGRSGRQRRRLNGAEYKKLQSNVEEVMPALDKTTAAKNFIY